jgi:Ca2+-transporting ATPase
MTMNDVGPSDATWHSLAAADVAARLGTDSVRGLSAGEAARRLAAHGPNLLAEAPVPPRWHAFVRQFRELVIGILIVAAALAAALGDWADATVIAAIVLVNAVVGFLQEDRARRALAALEKLAAPQARVVRDGLSRLVPAQDIVPGDLVELEPGARVPADARLVVAFGLLVQEAALTGESVPVTKEPVVGLAAVTPPAERRSMVHAGTVVAAGRGAAIIVATGMATQLGRIAGLLERSPVEPTPLQRRLAELGRLLIVVCLVAVAVIFLLDAWRGGGFVRLWNDGGLVDVMLRAVSLAVAAVPEGLPAVVTLVLAVGLQRLVARNALVRRLPSVETLGSVTVICSDKTGTLTRNEMTVQEIVSAAKRYRVTGAGYEPHGTFLAQAAGAGETEVSPSDPDLTRLLSVAARCTSAVLQPAGPNAGWTVAGDPTEGALLVAALKAGIDAATQGETKVYEIPFDSDRRRMSVVVRCRDGGRLLETKGAPEAVLPRCAMELRNGRSVPLDDGRRREILATAAEMADRALRVLSLAFRQMPAAEELGDQPEACERDLVHAGLVGMIDPLREEARAAVDRCRSAGIRTVMISGDHPATARAIARELGLVDGEANCVVSGTDLDGFDDERLAAEVRGIAVYARAGAEHKLRVVRAWQRHGEVVAMTGDGVNDAPAVRAADIGIAMGITGTDVTKDASDMVLSDDNFASIVGAVEEGRGIYDNIQKFIHYLLSCNAGEVLLMFVAAVAGWPAPLAATQILWLNLVTDGLPALALGLEPPERDVMRRPPRPPREPVVTRGRGLVILGHGTLVAAVSLAGFWLEWQGEEGRQSRAQTLCFCVAAFSQLFFAIGCRSERLTALQAGFFANPFLLRAIAVSALLQVTVVTLPATRPLFDVEAGLGLQWLEVVALSLIPVTVIEVAKVLSSRPAVTSSARP